MSNQLIETTALAKILPLTKRIRVIQGGTSAGKTFAIMMYLIDYAESVENEIVSVVAEFLPHLKKGAMRDFIKILKMTNRYSEKEHNKTEFSYTFESTGTTIEFFGADNADKVHGPRRDVLFINEGYNIDYETYTQLELRTRKIIIVDFNPKNEFWVHTEVIPRDDTEFLVLTYRDNEALEPAIIKSIELRKDSNPNWYRVYGLGEVGYYEGQIFENFETVEAIPEEAKLLGYGLDFGYKDPTAIIAVYYCDGAYYLDEVLYQSGMTNEDIAKHIPPEVLVVADSAEPKSIRQLQDLGKNVVPCIKGADSVEYGIQLMQDLRFSIPKKSVSLTKDFRNYTYRTTRDGKSTGVPNHEFSHAPDAVRYFVTYHLDTARSSVDENDIIFF